ncbi:AMP-binding protein [Micromonospora sp. NPDC050980]|uniref:AMP-binding protein n=1 Tax=Micromonospora sp. NPDC050980 TaxID=3155161 RepID=UPI003409C54F
MSTRTVPAAFAARVVTAPDTVAVAAADGMFSYGELDAYAEGIAAALRRAGVRVGDRVAVCLERSAALVATLLGVLKAGAAYLPLDPHDPPLRRAAVLADARPALGVTVGEDLPGLPMITPTSPGASPRRPDPNCHAAGAPGPEDLAYLMYTSGSTGRPKGVMVPHRAVVNLVTAPNYVDIGPTDRLLQLAPTAFDASTFEIWGALLGGARLEVAPPGILGPREIAGLVRDRGITVLWLTAALFHRQVDFDPTSLRGLRTLLAGGDVLSVPHVRALRAALPEVTLVNGYGPTETTTFALCHRLSADEPLTTVPIGRPIQGVRVEVRDPAGATVTDGQAGELWITGAGVASGYWDRDSLTAERFVPDETGAPATSLTWSSGTARRTCSPSRRSTWRCWTLQYRGSWTVCAP